LTATAVTNPREILIETTIYNTNNVENDDDYLPTIEEVLWNKLQKDRSLEHTICGVKVTPGTSDSSIDHHSGSATRFDLRTVVPPPSSKGRHNVELNAVPKTAQ
jgi:hypothetical protein